MTKKFRFIRLTFLFGLIALFTVPAGAAPVIAVKAPLNHATDIGPSTSLALTVANAERRATTVTFYGRKTTPAKPGPDFVLGTLPDTQYYAQNKGGISSYFHDQTQWYIENRVKRNIVFVSHMGDIVQTGSNLSEWEIADRAMARLEQRATPGPDFGIPWGAAPGNHDLVEGAPAPGFNTYFGAARFSGRTYYQGHFGTTNDNNWQFFSASGLDFIIIHVTYQPTDAQIAWADALIAAHPNRRAIVTSHELITTGTPATRGGAFRARGRALYDAIKDNPNLFLMLCGHVRGEGRRTDDFIINGVTHTVTTVLQDYQDGANGGSGFLRLFTFSPARNLIQVESYSPSLGRAVDASDGVPGWLAPFDIAYDLQRAVAEWMPIGTVNVGAGGTSAVLRWTGLEADSNYEWYATASDGVATVTASPWRFATAPALKATRNTPVNGAGFGG